MNPDPNLYIRKLAEKLKQNAVPDNSGPMKAYLKNQFEFFGLKAPRRRELFKAFFETNGLPDFADIEQTVTALFDRPEREFHYFAIELAGKFSKNWQRNAIDLFEKMAVTKSWWDSVDYIRKVCIGPYFLQFPENRSDITQRWVDSGNIWLQRLSVIFQLDYRGRTDVNLLTRNIRKLARSKEFFVQKAIGWALRQYARTDPEFVRKFIAKNELQPLSLREASKHLDLTA